MAIFSKDKKKQTSAPAPAKRPTPSPAKAAAPKPTQAQVQEKLAKAQRALMALGEIVSVLVKSRDYRGASLAEIYTLVMPAIASEQYLLARARSDTTGVTAPVAAALWARVSKKVDQRLSQDRDGPTTLKPEEWTSGDIPWLITFVGDARAINQMLEALQQNGLQGSALKIRTRGKDGKYAVRTLNPTATKKRLLS